MNGNQENAAPQCADQYITLTVAEYHFLLKAATMLEVVANDPTYNHEAVAAVKETLEQMLRQPEAGVDQ